MNNNSIFNIHFQSQASIVDGKQSPNFTINTAVNIVPVKVKRKRSFDDSTENIPPQQRRLDDSFTGYDYFMESTATKMDSSPKLVSSSFADTVEKENSDSRESMTYSDIDNTSIDSSMRAESTTSDATCASITSQDQKDYLYKSQIISGLGCDLSSKSNQLIMRTDSGVTSVDSNRTLTSCVSNSIDSPFPYVQHRKAYHKPIPKREAIQTANLMDYSDDRLEEEYGNFVSIDDRIELPGANQNTCLSSRGKSYVPGFKSIPESTSGEEDDQELIEIFSSLGIRSSKTEHNLCGLG